MPEETPTFIILYFCTAITGFTVVCLHFLLDKYVNKRYKAIRQIIGHPINLIVDFVNRLTENEKARQEKTRLKKIKEHFNEIPFEEE